MARVLVEKQVLFSGIWRPRHSLDERFHRSISKEFLEKPGARATWRLTSEGLTILVTQSESGKQGRTDQIPVTAIKQVTVNRYNPICLMTSYVDPARRFNVIVCRCDTEQDAAEIMAVFRELQRSLSGEGYRIDLKQPKGMNWMFKTKENGVPHDINGHGDLVVEMEEEVLDREEMDVGGRHLYNVGVQAELGDDDMDRESTASDMSMQSMKDELFSLSAEVRDIKLLLERTTGISAEEYFRRLQDSPTSPTSPTFVPVHRMVSTESEGTESNSGEKKVYFAADVEGDETDFDIRSIGMQTDSKGRVKYLKRNRGGAQTPARYRQVVYRTRSGSNPTSPASPMSPVSPAGGYAGTHFAFVNHGHLSSVRRDPRLSGSLSRGVVLNHGSTVFRPIESVYHVHSPGHRHKRQTVVVLPQRSNTMPTRRTSTERSSMHATTNILKPAPATGNGVIAKPAVDDGVEMKPAANGNTVTESVPAAEAQ